MIIKYMVHAFSFVKALQLLFLIPYKFKGIGLKAFHLSSKWISGESRDAGQVSGRPRPCGFI